MSKELVLNVFLRKGMEHAKKIVADSLNNLLKGFGMNEIEKRVHGLMKEDIYKREKGDIYWGAIKIVRSRS